MISFIATVAVYALGVAFGILIAEAVNFLVIQKLWVYLNRKLEERA